MIIQAQAAIADSNGSFTLEEIEVHSPQAGEVRVVLKASGICHTAHDSLNWGYHHVLGHEGASMVESVGEGVSHVKAGDKLLLNGAILCRAYYQCQTGHKRLHLA